MNTDLLAIIQKIKRESGRDPGKKQLQKLVYLIQAKGVDLGYEYGIHFYGPYSEEVSQDLLSLCVNGLVDFRMEGQAHKIVPSDMSDDTAAVHGDPEIVNSVINQYKDATPYYLELITTTHFAAANLGSSDAEILNGVKRIKGDKYPVPMIMDAIAHIKANYAV